MSMQIEWQYREDLDWYEYSPSPEIVVVVTRNFRGLWGWSAFRNDIAIVGAGGEHTRKKHAIADAQSWIAQCL